MASRDAHDLTDCERRLARAARAGDLVDLRSGESAADDPSTGAEWACERTVRAGVLYQLLVGEPAARAVVLRGARISGGVHLEASTLRCPLILEGCFFDRPINLRLARAEAIRLTGCRLACLDAERLQTRGDLQLNRTTAMVISLLGARVGGALGLEGVSLTRGCWPFELGGTTLVPFSDVVMDSDRLERVSLVADGLRVEGGMFCQEGFVAQGEVRLLGAQIDGGLNFNGASLANNGKAALNADRLEVKGGMDCQKGFVAQGEVRLLGAQIDGGLNFNGASLANKGKAALNADRLEVKGSMFCPEGFVAEGEVRLLGAHIRGQLSFDGARLANKGKPALNGDGLKVEDGMFCQKGFVAEGEVCLRGAHIDGQLSFDGARLLNDGAHAASGDGPSVAATALNLYEARVARSLWLRLGAAPEGSVDLRNARVGWLYDSQQTWPTTLSLQGLTYDSLAAEPEVDVKARLRWIERDPGGYAPQPYEQLIAFYRRAGQEADARAAAIAKQRRRRGTLPVAGRLWSTFLGAVVGHGYRAWLAGLWLVALWGVGAALFGEAYPEHFKPAKPANEIPTFNAPLYALDVILPVIDIKHEAAWIAEGPAQLGALLTIAGWVLATTAIAALTGLLRKD